MSDFNFINNILEGNISLGKRQIINDKLSLIPVYKIKLNNVDLALDVKESLSNGNTSSISVFPLCILKIYDDEISTIFLDDKRKNDDIFDLIPQLIANVDINGIVKGFKS